MTETSGPRGGRRQTIVIGIVAGLVAVMLLVSSLHLFGGWFGLGGTADAGVVNGQLTHTVKRDQLVVSFTERGTIKAAKSVPIYCEIEGSSTIVWVIPEGSFVKAGDLLVELDSSSLEQELNQQQISVESATAAWKQAEEQLKIQTSLNESNLEAARLDVELAQIDLNKYLEGDYPQAQKEARNAILIAEETLARDQDKYSWTKKLAAKGYVGRMDVQADSLRVMQAEVQHEQAKAALDVLEKYAHQKDLKTYQSALEQAKAAESRAKSKAVAELEQARAEARAANMTYELSVKRLKKLEDQLAKTKITAPQDGMVVYEVPRYRRGRETVVEQGAEVRENQQLIELPDTSVMAVNVQVHESWIDQMREGLPALISIDALPNLNLRGRVTKVGLLPDQVNRWLNPDLKVYKTEITIEQNQDTSLLRPGMSAKVQIIITKLENVVQVPVQSLSALDDKQVCYVLEGNGFEPREVVGGLFNESRVQIVSGLEAGEVIQLNAPSPRGGNDFDGLEGFGDEPDMTASGDAPSEGDRRGERGPPARFADPSGVPARGTMRAGMGAGRLKGRREGRGGREGRDGRDGGGGKGREGRSGGSSSGERTADGAGSDGDGRARSPGRPRRGGGPAGGGSSRRPRPRPSASR